MEYSGQYDISLYMNYMRTIGYSTTPSIYRGTALEVVKFVPSTQVPGIMIISITGKTTPIYLDVVGGNTGAVGSITIESITYFGVA